MAYYDALIAKWATLPAAPTGADALANLATINALEVPGAPVDVPVSAVFAYLGLNLKLSALQAYAGGAPHSDNAMAVKIAQELMFQISSPNAPDFGTSNPANLTALTNLLGELVADTANSGITAADQTAILALAATTQPWWEASIEAGGAGLSSAPNVHDLIMAGIITEDFAKAQGIH